MFPRPPLICYCICTQFYLLVEFKVDRQIYCSITNSDEAIPRYDEEWKNLVNPEETGSGNRSDVTLKGLLLVQMIVAVLSFVVLQMVTGSLISLKRA